MLWLLVQSSFMALSDQLQAQALDTPPSPGNSVARQKALKLREISDSGDIERGCLRRLALPQLVLAVTAFASFHVQIINRISSGYPIWYLAIATSLVNGTPFRAFDKAQNNASLLVVRWMVGYAIIQGGLYASFLPPAWGVSPEPQIEPQIEPLEESVKLTWKRHIMEWRRQPMRQNCNYIRGLVAIWRPQIQFRIELIWSSDLILNSSSTWLQPQIFDVPLTAQKKNAKPGRTLPHIGSVRFRVQKRSGGVWSSESVVETSGSVEIRHVAKSWVWSSASVAETSGSVEIRYVAKSYTGWTLAPCAHT